MNWTLLQKYLSEECNSKEVQRIENWLYASPENQALMEALQKVWEVDPDDEIEVDAKEVWDSFQHKITDNEEVVEETSHYQKRGSRSTSRYLNLQNSKKYSRSLVYALSAAAVVIIAVLFYRAIPSYETPPVKKQASMQQIITERGQRVTFRLNDGTNVQLNADSKLEVAPDYGDSTRIVYLEGEAYFNVAHDPQRSFIVHTGTVYTNVLGTKFGVQAYPEDDQVQVVVEEGKVAVGSSDSSNINERHLTKNQMGLFMETGMTQRFNITGVENYLGWKDGRLIFDGIPFRKVKPKLERWYNIEIIVEDTSSLNPQKLTASFKDEPLAEVLNVITYSLDLKYRREEQKVILFSR